MEIPFVGRFPLAGPMLQFEIVLLSLPPCAIPAVEKKITPPFMVRSVVEDPNILQFVIVLFVASDPNRMVQVLLKLLTVVLEIIRIATCVQTINGYIISTAEFKQRLASCCCTTNSPIAPRWRYCH